MEKIKPINREDWVDADPVNGVVGAIPPAKAFHQTMEEMVNVIIASGQTPSGTDLHQFEKGIKWLVKAEVDEANLLAVRNTVYQRNIGDLFFTHNKNKGTKATGSLNGSYQCNGDEFSAGDFKGDSTPYELLAAGKLPSVTYAQYSAIMSEVGFCGYFALDTASKKFKVPTISAQFLQAGTPGQHKKAGLPNITGNIINVMTYKGNQGASGALGITNTGSASTSSSGKTKSNTITLDASKSNPIYGAASTVQPAAVQARVMVQLANEIDNASSIESYIATLKGLKNDGVAAINSAADTALSSIETAKTGAMGNISTAQETAVNTIVGAKETAVNTIQEMVEEVNQTVETAAENIGELASLNEAAEENINNLTTLNESATEIVQSVNNFAISAANFATAAAGSATAAAADAERVLNGAPQITVATSTDTEYTLKIKTLAGEFTSVNLKGAKGDQGIQGEKGDTGDGFSIYKTYPSISEMEADAAAVPVGHFVLISSNTEDPDNARLYVKSGETFNFLTDMSGAQGIKGDKGEQGIQGEKGIKGDKGDEGAHFTPAVDDAGNLSWTNNGGLENPATVNIKGVKGDKGDIGERGLTGAKGEKGDKGDTGEQGLKGDKGDKGDTPDMSVYQTPLTALSATSGTVALSINKIHILAITGNTTFSLPTPSNKNVFNQIKVMLKVTGTPTITWGTSYFFNTEAPEIEAGSYDLYFDYDNHLNAWVAGAIKKGAVA